MTYKKLLLATLLLISCTGTSFCQTESDGQLPRKESTQPDKLQAELSPETEDTTRARSGKKFSGKATYYANSFHGSRTSSGEKYDKNGFSCAHRTLPFGTRLLVTNKKNGKSVEVVVNDRGPGSRRFIIDLSRAAASAIDMIHHGVANVDIEILEP